MLPSDIGRVDAAYLRRVCEESWPESQTLEFKRAPPSAEDRGNLEFLKDVCALANADGGDLVYGIEEDAGRAAAVRALDQPLDPLKRRLGQILEARVEPRLVGLAMKEVVVDGGHVLILRVPASFNGPHRYHHDNHSKFVARSGTHTSELTYEQLRMAFDRTTTLGERARAFRQNRLDLILAGKTWRPLRPGPTCVVHLVPLAAMSGRQAIDIGALSSAYTPYMFQDWHGGSRSTNLDGLVVHPGGADNEGALACTQVFRIGAFEAVRHGGALMTEERFVPSTVVSSFVREAIQRFLTGCNALGIAGPAVAGAAFLGVAGYRFVIDQRWYDWQRATADREHLILPETWIESVDQPGEIDSVARPMLDVLWQCFGIDRCLEYDADGRWIRR